MFYGLGWHHGAALSTGMSQQEVLIANLGVCIFSQCLCGLLPLGVPVFSSSQKIMMIQWCECVSPAKDWPLAH